MKNGFFYIFNQILFLGSDWWKVIIGLDNGLVPNRQQAIIKPMMTKFSKAYMNHQGERS